MGIWAGIKYALNSTLGTTGFKSLDKLISESKDAIITNGAIKSIKSVQSGYTEFQAYRNYDYNDITISEVDRSKCIVLLNGTAALYTLPSNDSSIGALLPAFTFNSNTNLRIYASGINVYNRGTTTRFSWQVIEFY